MTITLLLVLAGGLATEGTGPRPAASAQALARSSASNEAFEGGPEMPLWRSTGRPLHAFGFAPIKPSAGDAGAGVRPASTEPLQLQNPRTGATCTMRILEVKPTIDAGIVAPFSGPHPDPIVRNSSSPCVP